MKMKQSKMYIPMFVLFVCIANVYAQDWPQYLGPNRNSTSDQKGILRSWSENGPEVLWTVDVGIGYGGTVIKDGKVYLLDRDKGVGDNMRCFDFSNGKELWRFSYDAPGSVMFPGSRSVPAVYGNYVYSCGQNGDLYCIDINTHKPVWNKNIWTDFGGDRLPIWAITQCPLIYGDLLIVASQAPEAGVVAYDKLTGDLVWKTPNLVNESYASPSVVKIDGEDHIVMVISSTNPIGHRELPQTMGNIVGIEPLTGKILWEYNEWECHISVPSAVDAGNNKVLVVGGYELGTVMLKVEKRGDGSYTVTELYKHNDFGDHTKPPILHNGYFYAQFSTNSRRDGLVCMNMDGEIMWNTKRSPGFNKGSMILADGLILATDGRGYRFTCWRFNPKLGTFGTFRRQAPDPGSKPVDMC
ncbi:MAG: PQQ-binding-like beta-propeller repeat protein [Bacteroidetes bacterium]|nr:PQQ-binding-like beta-propeller repeat protein [Bacteroidota bacterium]